MSVIKFSNTTAKIHKNSAVKASNATKKGVKPTYEDREYYPVMVELIHLLEKTHKISREDEIISRIEQMENANPESVLTDGVFWQVGEEGRVMLLDERTLMTYQNVFEDHLDPDLIQNLINFLGATNKKRQADYLAASEEEKQEFKKIKVVSLG